VNLGFFADQDATRYCHLRLRRLKAAVKDPQILAALLRDLGAGAADSTGASSARKRAAIERRIEALRRTEASPWHDVPAPEVLAALIFESKHLARGAVDELFTRARDVERVVAAVTAWLKGSGLAPVRNIAFGTGRVDLVGYRRGLLSGPRVVAIQLKNDVSELEDVFDGLRTLAPYTNATYLACTPYLAAEYVAACAARSNVRRWDGEALRRKLQAAGAGLLLVEGDAVSQALLPKERPLDAGKVEAFVSTMTPGVGPKRA
jgi:hypothetical protein